MLYTQKSQKNSEFHRYSPATILTLYEMIHNIGQSSLLGPALQALNFTFVTKIPGMASIPGIFLLLCRMTADMAQAVCAEMEWMISGMIKDRDCVPVFVIYVIRHTGLPGR